MSEALALPTNSAPAPANSAMVIFRMSSSSFVQYLPSASSRVALFRSPRIERSDHPAWPPRGFRGPWFGKKEQRFPGRLRDCITHDNRTYVIEPRDGRPLRRSTSGKGKAAHPGSLSPRHRWTGCWVPRERGTWNQGKFPKWALLPGTGHRPKHYVGWCSVRPFTSLGVVQRGRAALFNQEKF